MSVLAVPSEGTLGRGAPAFLRPVITWPEEDALWPQTPPSTRSTTDAEDFQEFMLPSTHRSRKDRHGTPCLYHGSHLCFKRFWKRGSGKKRPVCGFGEESLRLPAAVGCTPSQQGARYQGTVRYPDRTMQRTPSLTLWKLVQPPRGEDGPAGPADFVPRGSQHLQSAPLSGQTHS